eukprot:43558-Eustigmatos_ZCMA.PRE.1
MVDPNLTEAVDPCMDCPSLVMLSLCLQVRVLILLFSCSHVLCAVRCYARLPPRAKNCRKK